MVYVRFLRMPYNCRAFTTPSDDDGYNVYINYNLTVSQQRKSLLHELRHIERQDFCKLTADAEKNISEEEAEADPSEIIFCGTVNL